MDRSFAERNEVTRWKLVRNLLFEYLFDKRRMVAMSTVAKGNAFENRVFDAIRSELNADRLGLSPSACRVFAKKGYYSRDRESDIIVDVSIEVWQPGASNWSLLWVCECKDYSGRVPVDDIEEFKAKLDQIAGANKKGIFATTGALQKSALIYAKNNGLGVVRLLPDDQIQYIAYMAVQGYDPYKLTAAKLGRALTEPDFESENTEFYGLSPDRGSDNWANFLRDTLTRQR